MSNLEIIRHSCAHVLAAAVKKLYPEVVLGIGPAIEDGFYYDFHGRVFTPEDLPMLEQAMREVVNAGQPFTKDTMSKEDAVRYFREKGERFKAELIQDLPDQNVSLYHTGAFTDLCKGPHVESTRAIKAFKLLSVSAAYWKGDQSNAVMQRIYGTAFDSKEDLQAHLKKIEEAKERDHRVLGKTLGLFDIYQDEAGAGLVFYHPHGAFLRHTIQNWEINEHLRRGYQMVVTPHIMDTQLWKTSGHWDFYKEYMYGVHTEDQQFVLKPMNCPGHILIYKSKMRSYKDLPIRFFELGTVYRYEKSGVLHGLLRVRGFTQDDAHIFCTEKDLHAEISGVVDFIIFTLHKFGFTEFEAEISTRPQNFIGEVSQWDAAEHILQDVLQKKSIAFSISAGEGAFYGPKIDFKLKDILGRKWQCATVQLDYALPQRFALHYVDADNTRKTPIMLHRVLLGSLERFMATLIEHYKGDFPLWLAPVQAKIVTINSAVEGFARGIRDQLAAADIRAVLDDRDDTLSKKIRESEKEKVPYTLVVGEKEQTTSTVSVRRRHKENVGTMAIDAFIDRVKKEVEISRT